MKCGSNMICPLEIKISVLRFELALNCNQLLAVERCSSNSLNWASLAAYFYIFLNILYSSELEVILIGGQDEDFPSPSSLVEIYSIEEGFISKLPSMPTAR